MSRSGNPARWEPMTQGIVNPKLIEALKASGVYQGEPIEAWGNRLYEAIVRRGDGITHLSIKRRDRSAIRDWRHLQQIKNDVLGPDAEAVELFPRESRLIDTANEYHLWSLTGQDWPLGWTGEPQIASPDIMEAQNAREQAAGRDGKGLQRAWQPGLTTGGGGRTQGDQLRRVEAPMTPRPRRVDAAGGGRAWTLTT